MSTQVYQLSGAGQASLANPPIISPRDPVSGTDIVSPAGNPYQVGQLWRNSVSTSLFEYFGAGIWAEVSQGTGGPITTLTGDSGGAISPSGGNITLAGTTNQITTTGSGSTITWSLPAAITTPGSLTTTTTLTAGTGLTVTSGGATITGTTNINTTGAGVTSIGTGGTGATNIGNATGNTAVTGSLTASTGLIATTGGITATGTSNINTSGAGVTSIGTGGTGATNIGNATGNTAVTGSLTASTTLTATLGAITATNGSFTAVAAGTGLVLPVATGSGAASGTVTCNGRVGSVTFTGVSIAAAADLTLTMGNTSIAGASTRLSFSMSGSTTGSAPSVKSVTPSANQFVWVVTNGTGATTTTSNITFDFIVLN